MPTKLIVGLGNPGPKYERSRHNVGFMVVDRFAEKHGMVFVANRFHGESASGTVAGVLCHVLKPMTFMNNSGLSVAAFVNYHKIALEDVIVVYDDMDIEQGAIRIRADGSSGGQNGMLSVTQHLGTAQIKRIRVGIGRPERDFAKDFVIDYVLQSFGRRERAVMDGALDKAEAALADFLTLPFLQVMSKHNGT